MSESSHWNWQGGLSKLHKTERQYLMQKREYKQWRKAVFERDNYICQKCGKRGNGELNADHIKSWALYPELRYTLSNGRTLCANCHRKTPTYGNHTLVVDK